MNRDAFLCQPDINAFVQWLVTHLPSLPAHLKFLDSNFVPGGFEKEVLGIEAVTAEYRWKGNWDEVSPRMEVLRNDLQGAVTAKDEAATLRACNAILDWGNVPKSKDFLQGLQQDKALVTYLVTRAPLLSPAGSQELDELSKEVFAKFNSGLTKVHALLCKDGSPIYDGRVGAAIALLYHFYRDTPIGRGIQPSNHRSFAWGPGIDDPDSERVRQIRNPAKLGLNYHGTPQLGTQSPHLWARRQLILGWIMRAVLEQTNWYGGKTANIADRCRAFEAGLFCLGYDLRAMVSDGWAIPDPTKRAYPRKPKTRAQATA